MSLDAFGAARWWHDLIPDPIRKHRGDRAALARLRRCATVMDAMQDPETVRLLRSASGSGRQDFETAALTAAVLAHVRGDNPALPVARQIGPESPDKPETAIVKPLRFRRIVDAETPDERLTAFRRLAAQADGRLNVANLARALVRWDEETRIRWTYEYWNAGQRDVAASNKDTVQ
jgi:CRISPR system Cascade subunit CasB